MAEKSSNSLVLKESDADDELSNSCDNDNDLVFSTNKQGEGKCANGCAREDILQKNTRSDQRKFEKELDNKEDISIVLTEQGEKDAHHQRLSPFRRSHPSSHHTPPQSKVIATRTVTGKDDVIIYSTRREILDEDDDDLINVPRGCNENQQQLLPEVYENNRILTPKKREHRQTAASHSSYHDRSKHTCDTLNNSPNFDRKTVTFTLVVVMVLERVAFYCVYDILLYRLGEICLKPGVCSVDIGVISALLTGGRFFLPIFGALLTCALIGRFLAVVLGSLLCISGVGVLVLDCFVLLPPPANFTGPLYRPSDFNIGRLKMETCDWRTDVCMIALLLVSLGDALMKSLRPMFLHQTTYPNSKDPISVEQAAAGMSILMSVGEVIAYTVVIHACSITNPIVPAGCMLLSLLLFLTGKRVYVEQITKRHVLNAIANHLWHRMRKCFPMLRKNSAPPVLNQLHRTREERESEGEAATTIKQMLRILPLLGFGTVYFCAIAQVESAFARMTTNNSTNTSVFETDVIRRIHQDNVLGSLFQVVISPLLFYVIIPISRWCSKEPSFYQKIGFGCLVVSVSILIGMATVFSSGKTQNIELASLVVQFLLCALGNSIMVVAGYQLTFIESPSGMEDVFIGMFLCTCGAGFGIGCIANLLSSVIPKRLGIPFQVQYYLLVITAFLMLSILMIVILSRYHPLTYVTSSQERDDVARAMQYTDLSGTWSCSTKTYGSEYDQPSIDQTLCTSNEFSWNDSIGNLNCKQIDTQEDRTWRY